jgi:hypothetical protein
MNRQKRPTSPKSRPTPHLRHTRLPSNPFDSKSPQSNDAVSRHHNPRRPQHTPFLPSPLFVHPPVLPLLPPSVPPPSVCWYPVRSLYPAEMPAYATDPLQTHPMCSEHMTLPVVPPLLTLVWREYTSSAGDGRVPQCIQGAGDEQCNPALDCRDKEKKRIAFRSDDDAAKRFETL